MTSTPDRDLIVEAIDVSRVFGAEEPVTALDAVSVRVMPGEFIAVQGPSGCGKSTLLHLLGALDTPTTGVVRFGGIDVGTLSDDERSGLRRRHIGMVLPIVDLVPSLSVWENVAVGLLLDGRPIELGRQRACELLDDVKLGHRAGAMGVRLSNGEAQRVALARALHNDPALIVADEPTSFLDSVRSDDVVGLLRRLADSGRTIVMATHDERAAAYADRSVRLVDGRVIV